MNISDEMDFLSNGIAALQQKDHEINRLIAPRYEKIIFLLTRYIGEIKLFNPAYGLVGVSQTKELVIRHILDSIAPLGIISRLLKENPSPKIADAGSGAGLPGIPLAITMPACDFTLIERMGRRAGFLYNTKAILDLSNVTVEENEFEKTENTPFNLITFRAFKPLDSKLLKSLLKACTNDGIIAIYKGRKEKTEKEVIPLKTQMGNTFQYEIIPYSVPFLDEQRHLLIMKLNQS